jgi:hypothetical protein
MLERFDDRIDFRRSPGGTVRQVADFFGDDGEPAPCLTGPSCLDGCVEGEQIRSLGDHIDRVDNAADFASAFAHILDDGG